MNQSYTLDNFTKLLRHAVNQSTYDTGHREAREVGHSTFYSRRPQDIITSAKLRQLFEYDRWGCDTSSNVQDAKLICDDNILTNVSHALRELLNEYIDPTTDRIGSAIPVHGQTGKPLATMRKDGLLDSEYVMPFEELTQSFVKAAAILGVTCVSSLLSRWIACEPVQYRISTLIDGPFFGSSVDIDGNILIEPLPLKSSALRASIPRQQNMTPTTYLGRTVVSILCRASPVFFKPSAEDNAPNVQTTSLASLDIKSICLILALKSDENVEQQFSWIDYGPLRAFSLSHSTNVWSFGTLNFNRSFRSHVGVSWDMTTGETTLSLEDDSIISLSDLNIKDTFSSLVMDKNKTRLALTRWLNSKDASKDLVDRFIDLRIALETLYLRDFINERSQEMRFRIALFAAWHLGSDEEDRKRIRKIIRDAYDEASTAVHTSKLEYSFRNVALLKHAQDLCRRGIIDLLSRKRLNANDWGDLILGIDINSD